MAILGPGPSDGAAAAPHLLVSMVKMNPGSGCLTVRTQMDGPVRVVQINDKQHRVIVDIIVVMIICALSGWQQKALRVR